MDAADNNATRAVTFNITVNLVLQKPESEAKLSLDGVKVEKSKGKVIKEQKNYEIDAQRARFKEHKDHHFDMTRNPKGKVLVINNDFKSSLNSKLSRDGSEKDVENLERAFKSLAGEARYSRVDIDIVRNKSSDDIVNLLKMIASSTKQLPSFVAVIIMSHGKGSEGHDDVVFGNDGSRCNVSELIDAFKSKKEWEDIPVMMFFQMCRGSNYRCKDQLKDVEYVECEKLDTVDAGAITEDMMNYQLSTARHPNDSTRPNKTVTDCLLAVLPGSEIISRNTRGKDKIDFASKGRDEADYPAKDYAGKLPNTLVSFATSEGRVSIRNVSEGSWYIEELCRAIEKHSSAKDVIAIMEDVHENVNRRRSQTEGLKDCVIASDSAHTFQKRLCLFPGFPEK